MKTNELIVANQRFTLLELLDRLLDKGVVAKGEILLTVADIDLVYLNLGLLLSSVKTVQRAASKGKGEQTEQILRAPERVLDYGEAPYALERELQEHPQSVFAEESQRCESHETLSVSALSSRIDTELDHFLGPKAEVNPENVERGLAKLVLTLVDLLRKLMEKQALRRMDEGQLSDSEIERVGNTFFLLDERVEQLKKTFGLEGEELNLDLGPLGELL